MKSANEELIVAFKNTKEFCKYEATRNNAERTAGLADLNQRD